MAKGKHISEDEIKYIVDVESAKAQQEIHKIEKSSASLRTENKRRLDQMIKLEAQGKKESQTYKNLRKDYNETNKKIRENTEQIGKLTKSIKVNDLTMSQLRKQAKQLQKQLDDTSRSLNPGAYHGLEGRLKEVKERMQELSGVAKQLKKDNTSSNTWGFLIGTTAIRSYDYLKGKMQELIGTSLELAESADGVAHAFNAIDQHDDILKNLRKATKGTVNDFELMKAAVQAKDFRIPLEDLGNYLAFAQLKAQQTGQSVEFMTNSIVTGLGRQSKQILDNLGISASEIDEKVAETGDFMKAVASIVENQLSQAGETYISAADRALRKTTDLQNAQLAMGQALLPWKEAVDTAFGGFQLSIVKAITWLASHRKFTAAATVAVSAFSIAVIALNASIRNYILQTRLARAATIAWQTAATTFRGIFLLMTAAVSAFTGNTTRAAAAMKLFNTTCKYNVYMAAATAIIAAGVALAGWITRNKQAKVATQDFMDFHKKMSEDIAHQEKTMTESANASTAERITKIKALRNTINDANESQAKRKAAIQDLQKLVPGYHASISGEGQLFAQNTKIIDQYISKLKQAALAEAAYERIKENQKKILDAQMNAEVYEQSIHNIKENAKRKTGIDLDEMNIGSDGRVRYNDVHDDSGRLLDRVKLDYEWDPGDKADYLKVQQRGIEKREGLVIKEKAVVDAYSKQNDRLWEIIKKNGGTGQSILNPVFLNNDKTTGNHKKGNTTDKVGQEQKSVFANERKEMLDQQEQLYQQSIESLKQNLIQRKITQEQYNDQELALSMAHTAKVYSIEQEFTTKAKQLTIKDANDKQHIILGQQANEEKARRDFQQKHLDVMKQYYDAQKQIEDASLNDSQKQERDHNLRLASLKAYYEAALEYARAHGEDATALTAAYEQARSNIIKDYEEKTEEQRLQLRQQYGLVTMQQQYDRELALLKKHLDEKKLSMEEYNAAIKKMEQEREDKLFNIRQQYGLQTQQELYEHQKQQLQIQRDEGYLTEEEYQEALKQMKFDSWKQQFDYYQQLFGNAIKALQDAELANVEAKYDAEIEAARQAGKDTTDLENKKANEKLRIEKKYADVNFAVKASQIIADTAVSIMKALAELGPIAGPVAAALMGVTGAAQLAAANAERQKVKKMTLNGSSASSSTSTQGTRVATGFEEGGSIDIERRQDGRKFHAKYDPDRRGYIDRPTVIVGEGARGKSLEWVASNAALQNPTVAPLIDIIDRAQRVGNISTLDMRKYLLQQQALGLQQGGYISRDAKRSSIRQDSPSPARTGSQEELPDTIQRLCTILDRIDTKGIHSFVAIDEIDAQQKLLNKSRQIGKKS